MRFVELDNWYDEQGGSIKIALDNTLSPAQNAQKYFKLYNKQKRAKEILTPMRTKEEAEIAYADSVIATLHFAETQSDLKEIETELIEFGLLRAPAKRVGAKKKETEVPFREYEHGGMKILVGRNNLQNDKLLKLASPDDIWLHTQKYHSAHAIIFTNGKQIQDETLLFTADICAYYSSGREADKIPVGCDRLLYLPYLMGERTPHLDPDCRGVFFGMSAMHTRAHFIRAVLEGVSYSLYDCVCVLKEMNINPAEMLVCGGGGKSEFWRQMLCDIFAVPVKTAESSEGPALGVAVLAAVGAGIYGSVEEACDTMVRYNDGVSNPDSEKTAQYMNYHKIYTKLYTDLKNTYKVLAEV